MHQSALTLTPSRAGCRPPRPRRRWLPAAALVFVQCVATLPGSALAADLPETISAVRRSVVAVGTFMAVRAQQHQLRGTGFVVAGNHAITNAHVVAAPLAADRREAYALFLPAGKDRAEVREASLVSKDEAHDLALLRFSGAPLPALRLGTNADLREGETIAFTGYPAANALGLFPVTHRGIISAVVPVANPAGSGRDLTIDVLKRLDQPFNIIQLDATAYPGNSGSPVYQATTGKVLGVINSVFIKGTKEVALTDPSGISYAIPVDHVRALLQAAGVKVPK
ncbi:MAG TPA: serine protease [Lamprocystis sp. (in: g-proteobacteria)]|nr:serine protease [Lamprocystis sp. (in: g-proteobacteria)]